MKTIGSLVCSLSLLFGLLSCATVDSRSTEESLAASGFQMLAADTAEKLANLKGLPAYKLTPHRDALGTVRYYYADPRNERIFVGDQFAYAQYQRRIAREEMAMDRDLDEIEYGAAPFDWGNL